MSKVIEITDDSFSKEVPEGKMPVMAEFYATWCPHCQKMKPIVEELAEEFDGKIKFCAIDVDKTPHAAGAYSINGIPTFLFFTSQNDYERFGGEMTKEALKAKLEGLIKT